MVRMEAFNSIGFAFASLCLLEVSLISYSLPITSVSSPSDTQVCLAPIYLDQ